MSNIEPAYNLALDTLKSNGDFDWVSSLEYVEDPEWDLHDFRFGYESYSSSSIDDAAGWVVSLKPIIEKGVIVAYDFVEVEQVY